MLVSLEKSISRLNLGVCSFPSFPSKIVNSSTMLTNCLANHPNVFSFVGLETASLPYYDHLTCYLAFSALNTAIAALPIHAVIVLQSSSHNPTGCDPSPAQWHQLAQTFKSRGHFAFFDAAYLGFVSGDAYVDAESVRIFADAGVPLLLAATYGKAFGLYGERVGVLSLVAPNAGIGVRIEKQMKLLARAETGAMPAFGARIVEMTLGDSNMRRVWEDDVKMIAGQLRERRAKLRRLLEEIGAPGDWKHITDQVGMFSYANTVFLLDDTHADHRLLPVIWHYLTSRLSSSGKTIECTCKTLVDYVLRMLCSMAP